MDGTFRGDTFTVGCLVEHREDGTALVTEGDGWTLRVWLVSEAMIPVLVDEVRV